MTTITRCSNPAGRARAGILGLLVVLSLSAASWGAACGNKAGGVGGGRLFYRLEGSGRPLVIIDVGIGETFRTWTSMAAEIAKTTSVLVYDRAGYGESGEGPYPRNAAREAAELSALLQAERIGGPYILVGHSLGGLNMQAFAAAYPDGVAGMLLLDPPPRGWLGGGAFPKLREIFSAAAADLGQAAERAARADDAAERGKAPYLRTVASEHAEMFGATARRVLAIRSFGGLPLIVIAAGRANPAFGEEAAAFQDYWIEESRKLAGLSTAGAFILAERSSHHIHLDAPDVVLKAVRTLITRDGR